MERANRRGRWRNGLDAPLELVNADLSDKDFSTGVYMLAAAVVNRAEFEAHKGNANATAFLNDWRSHFADRGHAPHPEFSEN